MRSYDPSLSFNHASPSLRMRSLWICHVNQLLEDDIRDRPQALPPRERTIIASGDL